MAVQRIDPLFAIKRKFNGCAADERLAIRQERSLIVLADPEAWLPIERACLPRHADAVKTMDYMLTRRDGFARFITDGRICLTNKAAERTVRGLAPGRKSWLFAGSDRGADRTAFMLTLIRTAKLNDVDMQAWLADVLTRIADMPPTRLGELLPWNWAAARAKHLDREAA